MRGLSQIAAGGDSMLAAVADFSLQWLLPHKALGTRASEVAACGLWGTGTVFVAHRLSCSEA